MKKTTYTAADLHMHMAELEALSLQQQEDLKRLGGLFIEDLKPLNIIKDTFKSTVTSPGFGKSILKGVAGLAAGLLSKRIFVNGSSNIVKKTLGTVLEMGVARTVAGNTEKIKLAGLKLFNKAVK